MMSSGGRPTQNELQAMLQAHLARDRATVQRLEGWKRVGNVLQGNGQELVSYLRGIALDGDPVHGDHEQAEVERLLLNFTSAAFARVDHSRRAVQWESEQFQTQYPSMIKTLGDTDQHLLLQGIRNYIIHVGLPPLTWVGHLEVRPESGLVTVLDFHLDREALRAVKDFHSGRKKAALDAQPSMIRLEPLIHSYMHAAKSLDAEVVELFERLHAVELEEDRASWREVQAAWKQAGFGAWVGAI